MPGAWAQIVVEINGVKTNTRRSTAGTQTAASRDWQTEPVAK
jgi:hypothetical protein